jgi:hypothetical protein
MKLTVTVDSGYRTEAKGICSWLGSMSTGRRLLVCGVRQQAANCHRRNSGTTRGNSAHEQSERKLSRSQSISGPDGLWYACHHWLMCSGKSGAVGSVREHLAYGQALQWLADAAVPILTCGELVSASRCGVRWQAVLRRSQASAGYLSAVDRLYALFLANK